MTTRRPTCCPLLSWKSTTASRLWTPVLWCPASPFATVARRPTACCTMRCGTNSSPSVCSNAISRRRRYRTETGELVSHTTRAFKPSQRTLPEGVEPAVFRGEQSNTSVVFGDRFVMKLIRKLDVGPNPDIEIGRYLTEKTGFPNIAALVGAFDYRRRGSIPPRSPFFRSSFPIRATPGSTPWTISAITTSVFWPSMPTRPRSTRRQHP